MPCIIILTYKLTRMRVKHHPFLDFVLVERDKPASCSRQFVLDNEPLHFFHWFHGPPTLVHAELPFSRNRV